MPPRNPSGRDVTALLRAWQAGDAAAGEQLTPLVYEDLRRLARRQLRREGATPTFSPTELVHESYMRLVGQARGFENRAHFFALAATMMRRILVDRGRRRRAARRGARGDRVKLDPDILQAGDTPRPIDILAVDEALIELGTFDAIQARIVEMHFFGGLPFEDIAAMLGISPSTVFREWRVARLWLLKRLSGEAHGSRTLGTDQAAG